MGTEDGKTLLHQGVLYEVEDDNENVLELSIDATVRPLGLAAETIERIPHE